METKFGHSVLLVSKDNAYTVAITFILNLSFEAIVTSEINMDGNLSKQYQLLQPDFTLIDLDSFNASEIESLQDFMTINPKAKLIALVYDDVSMQLPDKIFEKIIYKNKFHEGFAATINDHCFNLKEAGNDNSKGTEKSSKMSNTLYQWWNKL